MTTLCKVIIGILLAVILALGGTSGYLYISRAALQVEVANDNTLIVTLKTANEGWTQITKTVNDSIKKMQDAETVRATAAANAVAAANKNSKSIMDSAAKIEATKQQGDDCAATKLLLDTYFPTKK